MIDLKMWGRALVGMEAVSAEQWEGLDWVSRWLIVTRAAVLFMTLAAAVLAGVMAWRVHFFDMTLWLVTTLGLLFAHATNNLLNDYIDSRRGIDSRNYYRTQYGVHALEQGLLTPAQYFRYVAVTGAIALALGFWLVSVRSGVTFDLMLAGALFAVFYTWPLKYYGLGEPAVLLVWGPLMVGGTFYVITGGWSTEVTVVSVLFALGPTTVLFGKHTDKLEQDRALGVNTLPVLIGERRSRVLIKLMLSLQYAMVCTLFYNETFGWPLLLVLVCLVAVPRCWRALDEPKPTQAPAGYPAALWPLWFSAHTFSHMRLFSSAFLIAVIIDTALP